MKQAAAELIAEGFAVVPLVRGEKRPEHDGWLKRTFTPDDFETASCNIGAKCGAPSGHKVDVDLDAKEAVRAADLLPITRTHGRPGKPNSHHWFICADLKNTIQFKDPITGEMLCELRGTNGQTAVPPSTHPSGEVLEWGERRRPFLPMAAADLQRHVACVATVALFARHWPSGSRHEAALHIGGFLARLGIEAPHVERMVKLMAQIAGDEETGDRARAARESADKHHRGDKTTGAPRLADHFSSGPLLVKAVYSWFGRDGDDEIEALNAKHFVVSMGGGVVVGTEKPEAIVFSSFEDFEKKYRNKRFGKGSLGAAWLSHPNRREYDDLVFSPPGARWPAGPRDYNLWRGFAYQPSTEPRPDLRCARYIEHVYKVIADGNDAHAEYVLDLLADIVQRPGRLIGKVLALRGGMGVGKSVFVEPFGWLFGQRHFTVVHSRDQLVGNFNAQLSGKVVVFAEEAVWGGNRADAGTLKRLITQDTFSITRKHKDTANELNCVHLFMATNERWVYPAGNDERRLVLLDVAKKQPKSYYAPLWEEIRSPGFSEALLAVLLDRDYDEDRLRDGLATDALAEQKDLSAEPVQQWWRQVLDDGTIFPYDETWPSFVALTPLYQRFLEDMGHRGAGIQSRCTRLQFTQRLKELLPSGTASDRRRVRVSVEQFGKPSHLQNLLQRGLVLPSLQKCRAHYEQIVGSHYNWTVIEDREPEQTELNDL